ncbi:MAG TPA: NAD-binding protein [Sulfuricurvum sp.]|nr:NAD-binding protein [Sulfuricurvum sp.]
MASCAAVFGFNEYSRQIATQIRNIYQDFALFVVSEDEQKAAIQAGFSVDLFDLSDDWQGIEDRFNVDDLVIFCALANDAENVFLTISLRATFEKLTIISLAQDNESAIKMKSAGANKVLPSLQIAASVISDMLEKPIVTKVLHDVLYEDGLLNIVEIEVPLYSDFVGKYLHDIHFKSEYDVILLAIVDHELGTTFSFASKGHNHYIDPGDILVVIGYQDKLEALIREVRGIHG